MSIDVYQPCPCGSGKKLKFCCADLATEMTKVQRLQENEQFRLALQTLEHLDQTHPNNPWVATTRASILLQDGEPLEAARVLERLLSVQPDHVFAIALYALTRFAANGFEDARPAVYRAFQRSAHAYPDVVGGLAMGIANSMAAEGKFLAARAHLALAIRLVPESEREQVFVRLLEFDGDRGISYPERSVHTLAPYSGDDANQQDADRARRLAEIGCWGASAQYYAQLSQKEPQNAAVWQNLGLCRAWNGDEAGAAEALHRAATLQSDFGTAVELETLAQLLDQNLPANRATATTLEYPVKSVSKLLTILDGEKRLVRLQIPQSPDHPASAAAAIYLLLDRECSDDEDFKSAGTSDVPNVLGQVGIFDAIPEGDIPAHALVSAYEGDELNASREIFVAAAGEEIGPEQPVSNEGMQSSESMPREDMPLAARLHFPRAAKGATRDRLIMQRWDEVASSVWPQTALAALGGKTPAEASNDPALKIPLTAALYVFDALCNTHRYMLNLPALAESLKLELPPPLDPNDTASLNSFSSMRLNRLPVGRLSDDRLIYVLNRALLIHHAWFLQQVLQEVLHRPACLEKIDLNRVYQTLSDLARDRNSTDEALEWTRKGLEHARGQKDSFDAVFKWELRELMLRLLDPEDPQLQSLIAHMRDYYGPKLPNFEAYLRAILDAYGVSIPWGGSDDLATAGAGASSGGLWTPDSTSASASGGEKKLWLPGQQ
jgi:tetratricopeptide (TPR) repeat protein